MTGAAQEIRHMLAGKPGGVNLFLNRWGKLLVDYATALIPDRSDPFAGLVEDLLVDAISQARVIARAASDDQVRDYVIESAIRTTRARYREVLDARNAPEKATNSYTVEEILARTSMTAEDITRGVSEGRLRAVRADNTMRIKGGDVPGLGDRANALAYHVSAAERELLCLHYRLGWTPEHISRISGAAPAHVENLIQTAAMRIGEAAARKRTTGPDPNDAQMRRYLEGRLSSDETSRFEQRVVRDKAAQQRLEELRTERDLIRDLFDAPPFDLSRVAVHVRERNPHQPVAVPPAAALWVQVVGVAALLLLLQRVGAYLPPPDVRLVAHEGSVSVDDRVAPSALPGGRVVVGQAVQTGPGAQATLNLDGASRVQLAQNTRLRLEPPRAKARQVLSLERGELWGRFVSSGHAYVLAAAGLEIHGDSPADFDLAVGEHARAVLPDNLRQEQAAALVAVFAKGGSLAASRAFDVWAGYRVGEAGAGVQAQDMPLTLDHVPLDDPGVLLRALLALPDGETARLTVRRGTAQVVLPLRRETPQAALVLRVFRGTLALHAPGAQPEPLNRGQWALVAPGMPPLIGQRGTEDYQLLRMDASERFKDRLHWLNVESFPLRAENSLLGLDRRLRDFAAGLERLRATEVQRDGAAEIARFEEIMRGTIAAARARLEAGKGQPRDGVTGQLSDEELVRAENEILGTISHWKRQATTGTWPTLGSAAKTLHGRIQRDRDEMAAREADMTQALLLLDRIAALDEAIAAQQAAMEKLRQSDLFDADGSRRKELDAEITRHQNTVKAGNEARSRIELITLRLNELDQKLDDLRRKLPALRGDVAAAELALADIDKQLAANPYTAAALARLEKEAADAVADAAAAADAVRARTREQSDADSAAAIARTALTNAEKDATAPVTARDRAQDVLTDAVADRTAAAAEVNAAKAEVERLNAELAALAPDDPGRAQLEADLAAARKTLEDAEKLLEQAKTVADSAKQQYDAAESRAAAALKTVDEAKAKSAAAEQTRAERAKARQAAEADQARADKAKTDTAAALEAMKKAKLEREQLDARRKTADETLAGARGALAAREAEIAALDADAEPRRAKLAEERALVDAGNAAAESIKELRRRRDQHQAMSDELDLRAKDLARLTTERDGVAGSNYVKNYERTRDEFRQFSARVDALEFLRGRALLEDQSFALAQKAAQDRYHEAAQKVSAQAVALLDQACGPYTGFALADNEADARTVKARLMDALWRLYYDPLPEAADGQTPLCYHVAVQSGAGQDALKAIDDRWKLALAQVFDRPRYEAAAALKPAGLVAPGGN